MPSEHVTWWVNAALSHVWMSSALCLLFPLLLMTSSNCSRLMSRSSRQSSEGGRPPEAGGLRL
ncbi:hypothetical protein HPP92_005726 [Vanilla planifolia]|uniref:Uncharacterized protein n=1 Tax=Vanilla planifolia TaxID=51239 RepID=A0A835RKT1_VANPL|nr:hypothetical protein HPP92_005726 [Vanilla planifolia]